MDLKKWRIKKLYRACWAVYPPTWSKDAYACLTFEGAVRELIRLQEMYSWERVK